MDLFMLFSAVAFVAVAAWALWKQKDSPSARVAPRVKKTPPWGILLIALLALLASSAYLYVQSRALIHRGTTPEPVGSLEPAPASPDPAAVLPESPTTPPKPSTAPRSNDVVAGPSYREQLFPALLLFICTLVGMAAKTLWDAAEARKGGRSIRVEPWAIVRPMLISPIVFGAVWKSRGAALDVMTLCFAFQNGFTWQTILGRALLPGKSDSTDGRK